MSIDAGTLLCLAQAPSFLCCVLLLLRAAPHGLRCAAGNLRRPRRAAWVVAMLLVLPLDVLLTGFDATLAARLGLADLGPRLAAIEGGLPAVWQAWTPPALVAAMVTIYVAGFPALVLAALAIALGRRESRLLELVAVGFIANYVLVQPFYFFFPVSETHSVLPHVRHLMREASPLLARWYRPMSGLDNCFPSLHTSLVVTTLLCLRTLGDRRVDRVFGALGAGVVASTLYLGIHWLTDLAAGAAFGLLCHGVALQAAGARRALAQEVVG